jgi:DNA polymerase I-like protein with 3'-5' exonuclease and polymerase domains
MQNALFDTGNGSAASDIAATAKSRQAEFLRKSRESQLAKVIPNPEHTKMLTDLPFLNGEKTAIINFETTGLRWWEDDRIAGMSYVLPESGRSGYVPLRHRVGANVPVERWREWCQELKDVRFENLNTKFDLHMMEADGVEIRDITDKFGDAAHRAALLDDNRFRFNLDQLAHDILGWDVTTDGLGKIPSMIQHEGEFQYLHPGVVAPYAIRNVEQVRQLLERFAPQIEEEELGECLDLECSVLPAVVEFERNGLHLNVDLAEQWQEEVQNKIEATLLKVYKQTGMELTSFDSNKQLTELFQKRGLKSDVRTASGQWSFTDGVMKAAAAVDPLMAEVRTAGHLADLLSKYLDKYLGMVRRSDGWMRYNLHQLRTTRDDGSEDGARGTVSGRFSAAGDREGGFNPQQVVAVEKQLERGWCSDYVIRKLITHGPNEVQLLASDMMQVEYRIFAHIVNDPNINAAYAADPRADFHAVVMKLLHRLNPNLNRKLVKNINFALLYGAGLIKFCYMLGVIDEATYEELAGRLAQKDWDALKDSRLAPGKELLDAYMTMFPGVKPLLKLAGDTARNRGHVKDLVGRRARLSGRFHSALNRVIQGGAASINKRVVAEVYKRRKNLGVVMRCTVHDELVLGMLRDAVVGPIDDVLNTQYYDLRVPILWETKCGTTWAACK